MDTLCYCRSLTEKVMILTDSTDKTFRFSKSHYTFSVGMTLILQVTINLPILNKKSEIQKCVCLPGRDGHY